MSQPPYDPTRQFQPPPQQYAPPTGYPQPIPQYGPPSPALKKKGGAWKVVGIVSAVVVGFCVIGSIFSAIFSSSDPKISTTRPAAAVGQTANGKTPTKAAEPADDPGTSSKTFDLPAGTTMTITADDGSVTATTVSNLRLHKGSCGEFGAKPDNGSYLIADVVVTQVKGTGSINPLYFDWVGDDGTTSNSIGGAFSGCTKNDLTSTNSLREGAKRSGQIAFDVRDAKGAIEYSPGGLGSDAVGSWKAS